MSNTLAEFLQKHGYTTYLGVDTNKQVCCARFPERVDERKCKRMVHTYEFDYLNEKLSHTLCVGDDRHRVKRADISLPRHLIRLYMHFNFQLTCNHFVGYNFYHVFFFVDDIPCDYYTVYNKIGPVFPMLHDLNKEHEILEFITHHLPLLPEAHLIDFNGNEELEINYTILRTALIGAYELMETWHRNE